MNARRNATSGRSRVRLLSVLLSTGIVCIGNVASAGDGFADAQSSDEFVREAVLLFDQTGFGDRDDRVEFTELPPRWIRENLCRSSDNVWGTGTVLAKKGVEEFWATYCGLRSALLPSACQDRNPPCGSAAAMDEVEDGLYELRDKLLQRRYIEYESFHG